MSVWHAWVLQKEGERGRNTERRGRRGRVGRRGKRREERIEGQQKNLSALCFHFLFDILVLSFLPCCCDNIFHKNQVEGGRIYFGSRFKVQSIMVGKSRQLQLATLHPVRNEQWVHVAQLCLFTSVMFRIPFWGCTTHRAWVFSPQLMESGWPLQACPEACLPGNSRFCPAANEH